MLGGWRGRLVAAVLAAAGLALPALASAQSVTGFAIGPEIGTTGIGLSGEVGLGSHFDLRGTGDWLSIHHDATYSGIPYRGDWRSETGGVFADLHPFGNAFVISGGAYFGPRHLAINATPSGNVEIGHISFTPAEVGQLNGDIRMSDTQPFAGLGFDNTFHTKSHWSIAARAGVSFSGSPNVVLTSSGGSFVGNAIYQAALLNEQAQIASAVRNYRYFPVATIGLNYRF
jgi:hypothetical protein